MSEEWKKHDRPCDPCRYCGAELYERFWGNGGWVPAEKETGHTHGDCIGVVKARIDSLTAALAARDEEVLRMRAALRPFAAMADAFAETMPGPIPIREYPIPITLDDCRNARAALNTPAPADARACPHCGCNVFKWHEETSGVRYQRCRNCNERISVPADGEKGGG